MGMIAIAVPEEVNIEYKIKDIDKAEKIIKYLKRNLEKENSGSEIVGIWQDKYETDKNSSAIKEEERREQWLK